MVAIGIDMAGRGQTRDISCRDAPRWAFCIAIALLASGMTKRWLCLFIATPAFASGTLCPALKLLATLVAGGDPEEWPDGWPRFVLYGCHARQMPSGHCQRTDHCL
ncbi:hypothetical protein ASD50_10905 [Mesorhizobium sp. Root552]|nr:hypothetical protein ASD50_10905 [Mesorhizobium sp. Root552]